MALNPFFLIIKIIFSLLLSKKRKQFIEACKNPIKTQKELKTEILKNLNIAYPDSPQNFSDYEGLRGLSREKIILIESTSGSSGKKKEIPYTKSMLRSFQNMFLIWAHDLLFFSGINFKNGKFFMSVSPQIGNIDNDDRKYLSFTFRLLLSPFLVSNPDNHKSHSSEEFFFKISRDLLANNNLEIISIWSPTYLLALLNFMEKNQNELDFKLKSWEKVWPNLKIISCWTHAQAEKPSQKIKDLFPNVTIQGKGLLLTEAPITIPWSEANGNIPLITETIIEFLEGDQIRGIDQIEVGKKYTVLSGQRNGFLRYNTEDVVKVTGFYYKVPILEFVGRLGQQIDLAGEKFSEDLIRIITKEHDRFFFIIPDVSQEFPRYVILTELNDKTDWDQKLKTIYHYKLARDLRQLSAPLIFETKNPHETYLRYFQSKGMNLGDIKEKILFSNLVDAEKFLAWIQQEAAPFPLLQEK